MGKNKKKINKNNKMETKKKETRKEKNEINKELIEKPETEQSQTGKNNRPKRHKIEKRIIKNIMKGGFCAKYKGNSCGSIETRFDPIAPIGSFLNMILDVVQNKVLKVFTDGFNIIITEWNDGITLLSTRLEEFIVLLIFSVNGFTNVLNLILDDLRILMRIQIMSMTAGHPIVILSVFGMPIINELVSFMLDTGTIDIILSLFKFEFAPIRNFIKASLNLLIGQTVKGKCNLEDYGNDKAFMDSQCYEYVVPKCKVNLRFIFYVTITIFVLMYIGAWISFLKYFYRD